MRLFLGVLIVCFSSLSFAGNGPFTLGAILGDPTGLSGQYELGGDYAIDGALSWSGGSRSGTQIHGDYLRIQQDVLTAGNTNLDLYYGIGARLITLNSGDDKGKLSVGPRAPLGIRHELKDPDVELFAEVAFILDLVPSTSGDFDIGLGARYRF